MPGVAAEDGSGWAVAPLDDPAVTLTATRAAATGRRQAPLGRRMRRSSTLGRRFLPGNVRLVTITPDSKDWTWVLERTCPDCGYDASAVPVVSVADRLRANAA